jgi:very-short-patch-repair endonuclease
MDSACTKCLTSKNGRCKSCAAFARWAKSYVPRYCKTCSGEITSRTRYKATYCSIACKFADPEVRAKIGASKINRTTKACPGCSNDFAVPVSTAHRYNYCSRACSMAARGRDATCPRCGGMFRHGNNTHRRHCSEACRRPPALIDCDHCGAEFRVVPSSAGKRRFCSNRCYRASDSETSIERSVREALERLRLDHAPQAGIGPWVVDFLVGERLVVEADGSYWHSLRPHVDRRKTADLESRGYTVWRLSEEEIRGDEFASEFERRLTDHERAHGELSRVDELATG